MLSLTPAVRSRENAPFASEAEYRAAIDQCAAEGIKLEMTHIQIPESITLGLVDERDADIEQICRCIEAAGRAGRSRAIPCAAAAVAAEAAAAADFFSRKAARAFFPPTTAISGIEVGVKRVD